MTALLAVVGLLLTTGLAIYRTYFKPPATPVTPPRSRWRDDWRDH